MSKLMQLLEAQRGMRTVSIPRTLYHGTTGKFSRFKIDKIGRRDPGDLGRGIYLTKDAFMAMSYAEENAKNWKEEPTVFVVHHRLSNVANFSALIKTLKLAGVSFPPSGNLLKRSIFLTKWFTSNGYDGATLSGGSEVVAFDLDKLKIVGTERIKSERERTRDMLRGKGWPEDKIVKLLGRE